MEIQGPYFEWGSPVWIHYQVSPMIECHGLAVVLACLWGRNIRCGKLASINRDLVKLVYGKPPQTCLIHHLLVWEFS